MAAFAFKFATIELEPELDTVVVVDVVPELRVVMLVVMLDIAEHVNVLELVITTLENVLLVVDDVVDVVAAVANVVAGCNLSKLSQLIRIVNANSGKGSNMGFLGPYDS